MIVLSSNNEVCSPEGIHQNTITNGFWWETYTGSWKSWGEEKTENSLCITLIPLEQVPSTASRSN